MVGLRRRSRLLEPFKNVRRLTEHALADTLANLDCRSIGQLPILCAVDDTRNFIASTDRFGRRVTPL